MVCYAAHMDSKTLANLVLENGLDVFERMFRAVEIVQERLNRACQTLHDAQVPYAVIGGNAVAAWVATIGDGAVRNTRDVDLLLDEKDLLGVTIALQNAGFVRTKALETIVFLDGPEGKPSQGLYILLASRKVRPDYVGPAPSVNRMIEINRRRIIELEALVEMKLNRF